jgi:hypothetical protein
MPTIPNPAATKAGHKFLELYAEPVVTNTYLKVALLVLSVVTLALLALLYRAQTASLRLKPLIIAVHDIGRGQVMNYDDFSRIPIDRVSKYYLAQWAELYYGRNHATLERDFSQSLDFFAPALQSATLQQVNQQKTLQTFLLDPSAPNVDVERDGAKSDSARSGRSGWSGCGAERSGGAPRSEAFDAAAQDAEAWNPAFANRR